MTDHRSVASVIGYFPGQLRFLDGLLPRRRWAMKAVSAFTGIVLASLLAACGLGIARPTDKPTDSLEANEQLRALIEAKYGEVRPFRYKIASADLNGDGKPEAVVMLIGDDWCGTSGCTLVILEKTSVDWREVSSTIASKTPVVALISVTNGWRDLAVMVSGGGVLTSQQTTLKFGENGYRKHPEVQATGPQEMLIPSL
jgi:hypothetical protein